MDDRDAINAFYRRFTPTLVAFLLYKGTRLPDAADIAQNTMIKAYQRWSEIANPEAWVRKVAHHEWIHHRTKVRENLVADPPEHNSCLLSRPTNVEEWEQEYEILRLLDLLPSQQREVMAWTLAGGTPSEIACELGSNAAAVSSNLLKARRTLAKHLGTTRDEQ